ncbi:hypothetical protein MRX96_012450 [Rhipicephalus microplus]
MGGPGAMGGPGGMGGGPPAKRGRWDGPPNNGSSYQDDYYDDGASQDYGNGGGYDEGYGQAPVSRSSYQDSYAPPSDMMGNGYQGPGVGVGGNGGGYGDVSGGYNTDYNKPPGMERGGGDFRSSGAGYAPPCWRWWWLRQQLRRQGLWGVDKTVATGDALQLTTSVEVVPDQTMPPMTAMEGASTFRMYIIGGQPARKALLLHLKTGGRLPWPWKSPLRPATGTCPI